MRPGMLLVLCLASTRVSAEPRLEASGFVGVATYSDSIQLGDSWAPEQRPGTAPLLGARLYVVALPNLPLDRGLWLQLGVEGELALAASFTGGAGTGMGSRRSYFAPVLDWRAHGVVRLAGITGDVRPHLVVGLGGETVASESPFMRKETDPVIYWGPGISAPVADGWRIRIDARHGVMAAKAGITWTYEIQFGVAATFGLPRTRVARPPMGFRAQPTLSARDSDDDGLPDHVDACPDERETVNGIADDDGCPELDEDGDGVLGAIDQCPDQVEDRDGFRDDDGCPDPDNDGDGVDDVRDACPLVPELRNGFEDGDGCPNQVPAEVTTTLGAASSLAFGTNSARVTPDGKQRLAPVVAMLLANRRIRLRVVGYAVSTQPSALARRRADAVKWFLVDQGIAADRIESTTEPPAAGVTTELAIVLLPAT